MKDNIYLNMGILSKYQVYSTTVGSEKMFVCPWNDTDITTAHLYLKVVGSIHDNYFDKCFV